VSAAGNETFVRPTEDTPQRLLSLLRGWVDDDHEAHVMTLVEDGSFIEYVRWMLDDVERFREELMRCGALAISDRADGCINKTIALRIREIAYRSCWPDDQAAAGEGGEPE
jgi:hypothetical protein